MVLEEARPRLPLSVTHGTRTRQHGRLPPDELIRLGALFSSHAVVVHWGVYPRRRGDVSDGDDDSSARSGGRGIGTGWGGAGAGDENIALIKSQMNVKHNNNDTPINLRPPPTFSPWPRFAPYERIWR